MHHLGVHAAHQTRSSYREMDRSISYQCIKVFSCCYDFLWPPYSEISGCAEPTAFRPDAGSQIFPHIPKPSIFFDGAVLPNL
jgi:hypothetical protein